MFAVKRSKSRLALALSLAERTYHATVRASRKGHTNAILAIGMNVIQSMLFVAVFLTLFYVLGIRGSPIRGDFLLFVMSGVFLFMVHTKSVKAVAGAEGATSGMMQHAPMNTVISILSSALSALYIQVLSMMIILMLYHLTFMPITIDKPIGALGMVLLAWISGVAVGLILMAINPWFPQFTLILTPLYQRANMVASGKMVVGNTLTSWTLMMFNWNPLFHIIDQCRGFVFLNYNPHYSSIAYPVRITVVLVVIGLMIEFYTRRHASRSWAAG